MTILVLNLEYHPVLCDLASCRKISRPFSLPVTRIFKDRDFSFRSALVTYITGQCRIIDFSYLEWTPLVLAKYLPRIYEVALSLTICVFARIARTLSRIRTQ